MLLEKETFLLVDLAHLRNCLRGTMPVANSGPVSLVLTYSGVRCVSDDFSIVRPGQKFTVDQFIDDWIFLCYFVGNDFLPHLPSLSIQV